MGSYSYYAHERTASVELPYSFQCEQCMKDSGSQKVIIKGFAEKDNLSKELSKKADEKLRQRAHKNLVKRIKKIYNGVVQKQVFPTMFSDECPYCHKPQSWGVSGMKKEMFDLPIFFFGAGIFASGFCLLIYLLQVEEEHVTIPVIVGVAVAGTVVAIISLIWEIIKINQKKKITSTGVQKNLPVIEWESVQYLLDE